MRQVLGREISVHSVASPMLFDDRVRAVLIAWSPVPDPGRLVSANDSIAVGRPPAETLDAAVRPT